MDRHTVNEIIACLRGERSVYRYYRDRYSIGLLRHLSGATDHKPRLSIPALKRSPYASLLQKPRVKSVLSRLGRNSVDDLSLAAHDDDPAQEFFVLTLDTWGSERRSERRRMQTSRSGYNLVLQLNFSSEHDRRYRTLGCRDSMFNYSGHPVSSTRNTLAWARIDLDWESNCALIEEIQSDWVRSVAWLAERVERRLAMGKRAMDPVRYYGLQCSLQTAQAYCVHVRQKYADVWDEAMLWAAFHFVRRELGLKHVYYHSALGGGLLKGISGSAPPRSLYTDLPRRFCFASTRDVPPFLEEEKEVRQVLRRNPGIEFFHFPDIGSFSRQKCSCPE